MRRALLSAKEIKEITNLLETEREKAVSVCEPLLSAPEACSMIEILNVLANCTKDFSLKSDKEDDKFHLLTTPDSFKASLYQVTNEMSNTFIIGSDAMSEIEENLSNMPSLMNYCLEALNHLDDPNTQSIIKWAKSSIEGAITNIVSAAQNVNTQCVKTRNFINELTEKAKATQGRNENRAEEVKGEIEFQNAAIDRKEKELREIVTELEEQREIVAEAWADHRELMSRVTNLDDMFNVMVLDCVNNLVQAFSNTASNVAVSNFSEAGISAIKNGLSKKSIKKADVISQAREEVLYKLVKEIMEENSEEIVATFESSINKLKSAISQKSSSESGKILHGIGKDFVDVFTACQKDDTNVSQKINQAKERAQITLDIYEQTVFPNQNFESENENSSKNSSHQGKESFLKTRMDTAKISQDALMLERKVQKEMRREKAVKEEELYEVVKSLKRLEVKDLDLGEIICYLREGMNQLQQVQTTWINIMKFFTHVKHKIEGTLKMNINGATTNMSITIESGDKEVAEFQRKILYSEITKAILVASVVMQCAGLYNKISNKYVEPILARARRAAALQQSDAQAQHSSVIDNFENVKADVKDFINNQLQQLEANIQEDLKKHGFDVSRAIQE